MAAFPSGSIWIWPISPTLPLLPKNLPVDDDAGAGTAVEAHQNRVFAVAGGAEVVLRQRQAADVVADETGDVEALAAGCPPAPSC